jgi:SAM-dependent methyltransferase
MNMSEPEAVNVREDRYRPVLAAQSRGKTLRGIYEQVYGADYPAEVEPFGFSSAVDLAMVARELDDFGVTRLLDVGCGRGGPGLWVAREVGAALVGIDILAEAITEARARAAVLESAPPARFEVASVTETGLPDGAFDGVVSFDALWMVIDKRAAFREISRVLRPGSPLVFTTWEPAHLQYALLLQPAGFMGIIRHSLPESLERQLRVYEAILDSQREIATEMGEAAAAVLVEEARQAPATLRAAPHVMICAIRT